MLQYIGGLPCTGLCDTLSLHVVRPLDNLPSLDNTVSQRITFVQYIMQTLLRLLNNSPSFNLRFYISPSLYYKAVRHTPSLQITVGRVGLVLSYLSLSQTGVHTHVGVGDVILALQYLIHYYLLNLLNEILIGHKLFHSVHQSVNNYGQNHQQKWEVMMRGPKTNQFVRYSRPCLNAVVKFRSLLMRVQRLPPSQPVGEEIHAKYHSVQDFFFKFSGCCYYF